MLDITDEKTVAMITNKFVSNDEIFKAGEFVAKVVTVVQFVSTEQEMNNSYKMLSYSNCTSN